KQLGHPDAANPSYLVLVTGADAPAGGADGLSGTFFAQPLLLHVIGEDHMGVITESEVGANRDAGGLQLLDLLEEARWINDQPIGNDRLEPGVQDTRRQQRKLVGFPFGDDGMAGIGTAVIANDQVVLFGE